MAKSRVDAFACLKKIENSIGAMNINSNGKSGVKLGLVILLFAGATFAPIKSSAQNLLQNGSFGTGGLDDWTVFVTGNGDVGAGWGLPNVVSFDVAGTGTPSLAAQFEVGEAAYNAGTGHTSQGGGIYQTFNSAAGKYIISANLAAFNPYGYQNADAGLFTLSMDGTTLASVELGAINSGQTLRNTLDGTFALSQGSHEITLEITRPWLNENGGTPYEYLDNILVEPVPEPSAILVGLFGLFCILIFRKTRNRHLFSATATLIGTLLLAQSARSQQYTVGDYTGPWVSNIGVTGFGISNPNTDGTAGQTFVIRNVNALVDSITFPVYWYANTSPQFQVGVAAWNGSHPVGPALYLSDPLSGSGGNNGNWQTYTLSPHNLILNQGQEYMLFLTPNAFVNSSPAYNNGLGYVSGYSDGEYYDVVGYEMSVSDLFNRSWTAIGGDMAFSITYQPAPTPEPAASLLLCLGGLALWRFKRIRS